KLKPGKYFELQQHPSAALNRLWQVVSITHHGLLPQVMQEEASQQAASLTNHFDFMPADKSWRPPFVPKPTADGPEVAQIVGPANEEIFTNELGQVRVHFHWNRLDKADEKASCWVRVCQGWNGDNYG